MASSSSLFSGLIGIVFLCVGVHVAAYGTQGQDNRPVMFIFGDSTVDVGTNNFLNTTAKANSPYYGIDFPNSLPRGRFSNGFNIIDHIAKLFGYEESPLPYMALKFGGQYTFNKDILGGVNFASGGSGILRETGKQLGEVIPFDTQVEQFKVVRGSMLETLGVNETATFLSKAVFIISVGGNDLLGFNGSRTAIGLGQQQYLSAIQSTFNLHILNLYKSGARKFGIINVPAIGCCPAVRANNSGGNCKDELNQFAIAFNNASSSMLERLSCELKDFRYSYGNSFDMTWSVLQNPKLFGIKETGKACCGVGYLNGQGPCLKILDANLCEDRNDFLFWDWFHPTDNMSLLAAFQLYTGPPRFVFPINFRQLSQI